MEYLASEGFVPKTLAELVPKVVPFQGRISVRGKMA